MLFEITSSLLLGSLAIYSQTKKSGGTNDASKIQTIFNNCGLVGKDGETCQILRKRKIKDDSGKVVGVSYVYRHPLGLCEDDFKKNFKRLQDGLNVTGNVKMLSINDLKSLKLNKLILQQIKDLTKKKRSKRKEIELQYDNTIKINVYNEPMSRYIEYKGFHSDGWRYPIGVNRMGGTIYHNFDEEPHFLIGGATGGGKSNALNLLISHFLYTKPEHVKLSLIDLKGGVEFEGYRNCKQVVGYAEEPFEALEVLQNVMAYIERMKNELKVKGFRNVIEAGIKDRHFLIIDEIAELSPDEETAKKAKKDEPWTNKDIKEECWRLINIIARQGRSWGVKLVSATQHPIQANVPSSLKRNSEGKLCFLVEDDVASRVVLGVSGGESLPNVTGRALYKVGAKITEIQTFRIKDETIKEFVKINIRAKEEKQNEEEKQENEINESEKRTNPIILKKTRLS